MIAIRKWTNLGFETVVGGCIADQNAESEHEDLREADLLADFESGPALGSALLQSVSQRIQRGHLTDLVHRLRTQGENESYRRERQAYLAGADDKSMVRFDGESVEGVRQDGGNETNVRGQSRDALKLISRWGTIQFYDF